MRYIVCITLLATCAVTNADETSDTPEVLFAEDFESGLDRWEIVDPKTWALRDQDDGSKSLEITARGSEYKPAVRSPGHIALVRELEVADFTLTFRVRSTKDTGNHRDCCVFFGYQDPTHFYYVHLGAVPDPHSGQIMIVNDAPRLALTTNENKVPWDDDWHTVKLERRLNEGTIRVYFDDMQQPLMEVVDKTFGKGRIGIGSFDDLNEFDDIKVTE